jgi:hypothetical protein
LKSDLAESFHKKSLFWVTKIPSPIWRFTFHSQSIDLIDLFIVFDVTFSNISAISWQPVLVVEEAGVPRENHRPWASNW